MTVKTLLASSSLTKQRIAILFQALVPPIIDGQRKAPKPGGYSDSGADIGFSLKKGGFDILTPAQRPNPDHALDWVFPDTTEGIEAAIEQGATVLWANTVLFTGHPLEKVMDKVFIVGQYPARVEMFDDKFKTNKMLAERGLPVARSYLIGHTSGAEIPLAGLDEAALATRGLEFPLMLKPLRGRGSQGVIRVAALDDLKHEADALLNSGAYGSNLILEEYLSGEEMTITVMCPNSPRPQGFHADPSNFWALRPVCRFNHADGVAPYNGVVAVTKNSRGISPEELALPAIAAMIEACVTAAELVDARAPIRIDCRADSNGKYRLFDLNMKPNMTGAGRSGREDQDSLSAIAARAEGWSYLALLESMLAAAWKEQF